MFSFVGSVALNHYLEVPNLPNDIDAIATYEEAVAYLGKMDCVQIFPTKKGKGLFGRDAHGLRYEIEIAWPGTLAEQFLKAVDGQWPSLDWLYTLKMSHRYLKNSPHFLKTRGDILVMRDMGAKIADQDWYEARMKETYYYEHPDLTRTKEEFFVDQYQYDHDTIHEAVAMYGKPAYTYYQREGAKGVSCSKAMFFELDEKFRIAGVMEEAMVLSLERSLIPFPNRKTEQEAFDMALMKVCTSITSGWFREFAWENYGKVRKLFQKRLGLGYGPLAMFERGLKQGVVKENPNYVPVQRQQ